MSFSLPFRSVVPVVFLLATAAWTPSPSFAAEPPPPPPPSPTVFVEAKSYSTKPETDPPRYVRTLNKTGFDSLQSLDWLDLGFEYRTRFEVRADDLRRPLMDSAGVPYDDVDLPLLLRARLFVAIKEIVDPFRLTIEMQDSRRYVSQFPEDDRDWNVFEPIQAFAELHFKNGLGAQRPLCLRAGRMAFEVLDRRLIARNEWRNTTNTFQGFRATAGRDDNVWALDLFALQPLVRKLHDLDETTEGQWFFGAIGAWRGWSRFVTLQPYWFWLKQDADMAKMLPRRNIHAAALRGYGIVGKTGLDYDASVVLQLGSDAGRTHRSLGLASEVGYTFESKLVPRLSAFYGYGGGDENPMDDRNQRFERFFGFARPWSNNDYFRWENLHAPKLRLELSPSKRLRGDGGYSAFWLASATDRWNNANLRDPMGQSGTFIGHELDFRVRWRIVPQVDVTVGYAYFNPGAFPSNLGRSKSSHFAYLEVSVWAFE